MSTPEISDSQRLNRRVLTYAAALLAPAAILLFVWPKLVTNLFASGFGEQMFMPHGMCYATYWLSGYVKLLTAASSVATAVVLPFLVPKVLTLIRAVKVSEERREQLETAEARVFGFPHVAMFDGLKLFSFLGVAGILELGGGLLLLLGLFTRPVAFVLSGFTAAAYFIAHAQKSFFPILNQGELAVLYCFVLLYLAAAGGGPWSLDEK